MSQILDYSESMEVQVLGISGSPILDSNTDRAVKRILLHTGLRTEFIKLSDYTFSPCRACLGCVNLNECVLDDDARELSRKFRKVPAFVLGGYTPYGSLDSRTKAFMERMYCFRHISGGNAGKLGVSVITSACRPGVEHLPPAAEIAANQIGMWMMEEGMENLGSLAVLGNVPCIRCGRGDNCPFSGVKMLHGERATIESIGVNTFEENEALLQEAKELGKKIRAAVLA